MAHKTLIGGTAHEIIGGKTLVDGTAYSIKNGKTLVGGTAYEVGFVLVATIMFTNDAQANDDFVSIYMDGTDISSEVKTNRTSEYVVQNGTVIKLVAKGTFLGGAKILVNGITVASGSKGELFGKEAETITYEYIITSSVEISICTTKAPTITITT